jgi:lipopolysaccharide transport system permease protein
MDSGTKTLREEGISSGAVELLGEEPNVQRAPTASGPDVDLPLLVIEPRPGWHFVDLGELWRCRELLYFLTWRDIKVRYKQTVLGAAWAVLQPLATMVVFTFFLGRVAANEESPIPYALFVFAGLLPWTFFATALASAGGSIVGNQNMVTKIYFPRLIIPMGAVGAGLVDLFIGMGMLVLMMFYYTWTGHPPAPGWGLLMVPVLIVLLLIAALGVGILLSALTVAYRDFRHVVPFMVQIWMFATPTIYLQTQTLGPRSRTWLPLNPAYGLIGNFRQALLGGDLDFYSLAVSSAVSVAFLIVGCIYFRRVERSFADII